MRLVELAGAAARPAPGQEEAAVPVELHHPVVRPVAVGDEDVAVGVDHDVARPVEGVGTVARDPRPAEGHQDLAARAELEHLVPAPADGQAEHRVAAVVVGRPEVALGVDVEAVRGREHPLAPTVEELAVGAELDDRRVVVPPHAGGRARRPVVEAAVEDPDVPVRVAVDADRLAPPPAVHVRRQVRPFVDEPVRVGERLRRGPGRHAEENGEHESGAGRRMNHHGRILPPASRFGACPAGRETAVLPSSRRVRCAFGRRGGRQRCRRRRGA